MTRHSKGILTLHDSNRLFQIRNSRNTHLAKTYPGRIAISPYSSLNKGKLQCLNLPSQMMSTPNFHKLIADNYDKSCSMVITMHNYTTDPINYILQLNSNLKTRVTFSREKKRREKYATLLRNREMSYVCLIHYIAMREIAFAIMVINQRVSA